MHVTIYTRLSLDRDGDALGVTRQEQECRAYIEQRGWSVREVFSDNDTSATTGVRRPGFEALLASEPEAIVVWHTDRLVRVARDLERVIELGVNIYAVTAGHLDLSTPAGRAVARTVTAWATYEGEQKSERQRASHRQRARAGRPWWSHRPFGYERDGALRQPEADALRKVYRDVLMGGSIAGAVKWLNGEGVWTVAGKPWRASSLRHSLRAARNAGVLTHNGEVVGRGDWEAIVTEEQWLSMQRLLDQPERRKGGGGRATALLTGIATCAKCSGGVRQTRHKGRRIYQCSSRFCFSHDADWCDTAVGSAVVARLLRPDFLPSLATSDRTSELGQELADVERRHAELLEDYADGVVGREDFRAMIERVGQRREALQAELARAGIDSAVVGVLDSTDVAARWDGLTPQERRAVVQVIFDKIELVPRGRGNRGGMRPENLLLYEAGNTAKPLPSISGAREGLEGG